MGKEHKVADKEKRKEKKDKKRSETDGVHKKSSKKDKKKELPEELTTKVLEQLEDQTVAVDHGDAEDRAEPVEVEARPIGALVPFANPLVEDKTAKKVLKSVKKAAVNKSLKRGVKEVVKALRKSSTPAANATITSPTGVVILAADISPMDVISHIPVLCEDHGIPYVYVTSRAELGAAGATKRPTSVVMVVPKSSGKSKKKDGDEDKENFGEVYDELVKVVQKETKKVKI